jgi:hypothetical protein
MFDDNWDLINGEAAHKIEYLNASNVVNLLEAVLICEFRFNPATDSDLKPAGIPI